MAGVAGRRYQGERDLERLADFVRQTRGAQGQEENPAVSDLAEQLSLSRVQDSARLWLDGEGQVVGYALVDSYDNLVCEWDAGRAAPGLPDALVKWGMAWMQARPGEPGEPRRLDAGCDGADGERIALLERHGFVQQMERSLRLRRVLALTIPAPALPAGFLIRPSRGAEEAEAWVRLHRAAFGTQYMTVEERLAMISGEGYDPELDLAAAAPGGELAAYCVCSINRGLGGRVGYTDPVATHPDYQRRGLARALLLHGLRLLQERGVEEAWMGTSSENVGMLHTAQGVGFEVQSERLWFWLEWE
jgi:ribosomal protein S18 acetylase RimI-like enzyme